MELDVSMNDESEAAVVEDEEDADDTANENEKCGICTDVVIDRGVLDCCDHWFCFACIDNWATITNLCPFCKHEFQLITCLPVYDTIGNIRAEEHSFSRDDDWCVQEKNNTLSFPSYYIDEDAVLCLDNDGCKIRNGLSIPEEDFTFDTSIACDSCDIWYHAFCVGFNPEGSASESSWLCPRCITDDTRKKSDGTQMQNLEEHSAVTADVGWMIDSSFSKKVSVSVADDGETAVVVSMVEAQEKPEPINVSPSNVELDFSSDKETESSLPDIKSGYAKVNVQLDNNVCAELICNSAKELENEKRSEVLLDIADGHKELVKLPLLGGASELAVTQLENNALQTSLAAPVDGVSFPLDGDYKTDIADGTVSRFWTSGVKVSAVSMPCDTSETKKQNLGSTSNVKIASDLSAYSPSEDTTIVCSGKDEIDVQPKNIKFGNLMEYPKEERQPHVIGANCLTNLTSKRETETVYPAEKAKADEKPQTLPLKSQISVSVSENSKTCSRTTEDNSDDKVKSSPKKARPLDIMSIVQEGPAGTKAIDKSLARRENANGLRVKKIMRRAGTNEESSNIVQKLRKEIREAVQDKTLTVTCNDNDFDIKLLTAFRAAIVRPKDELINKISPHKNLKKSLLQKGKTRENLTKKIYGTSNGRRKRAWDRDWEIEFWKHRCKRTKSEKVETLHSVLELLKKATNSSSDELASGQGREGETNSILSRVYLADTSVFPRKNDIKPLSNLTGITESADKSNMTICPSGISGSSTQVKVVSSNNSAKRSVESAPSESSSSKKNLQNSKEIANQSGPTDKKKWALEVLARKNASINSAGSKGQEEDKAALKGNYPLLAQLPADMRPVPSPSLHNKVPLSVRQVQLYRITEHYLRRTNLSVMRRTADTELAVADAVNVEKEICERSNSKLVYINLCSQGSSQKADKPLSSERTSSTSTPAAVEATGNVPEESFNVEEALKLAGLLSDSPTNSPCRPIAEDHNVEDDPNVLGMDSHPDLDINGDFANDLEDEGYSEGLTLRQKQSGDSQLKVILSTVSCDTPVNLHDLKYHCSETEVVANNPKDKVQLGGISAEDFKDPSSTECEQLCGSKEQPFENKTADKVIEEMTATNKNTTPCESERHQYKGESTTSEFENEVCAGNRLGGGKEPLKHVSSGIEKSPTHSLTSGSVKMKRAVKLTSDKDHDSFNTIFKKVEAYVKEHIRPLCKSGVITVEQYRWAVGKATDKVMKYHHKDKNANFLIKEGEKVKKLAEQYVEASQKKDS